jgi:DNA polymerase (family 10)
LIGRREPYELDLDALFVSCAASGTLLEINANPNRRDLSELHARAAAAAGVGIVINSDAHSTAGLDAIRFGVWTARRAWLGAGAVANTRTWPQLATWLTR